MDMSESWTRLASYKSTSSTVACSSVQSLSMAQGWEVWQDRVGRPTRQRHLPDSWEEGLEDLTDTAVITGWSILVA